MSTYEVPIKDSLRRSLTVSRTSTSARPAAKIFVVCTQGDTAPVWGYILRQGGLIVILETSLENALGHWSTEMPDLVVLDLDMTHEERMDLYRKFRAVCVTPILLFLPSYHETEVLEAYQAGIDDVAIKPISPPVFLAKIMAWVRRSWTVPMDALSILQAGKHELDPIHRCLMTQGSSVVKLTNLEFRMLHLLMSRPGAVFGVEEIIQSMWGAYGDGDQILLKNVVYRLRKKIEDDPGHPVLLQTWPGGYSFHG